MMRTSILIKDQVYVKRLIEQKVFSGYTGVNINRVNAYLSSLSHNLSGKPISKDKWPEKLRIIKTEMFDGYKLYQDMTYKIPLHMKDICDIISATAAQQLEIKTGSSAFKKVEKFYFRLLSECGTKVLEQYFFLLVRWLNANPKHTIKQFTTTVPLQGFFDIVFIKLLNIKYRKKWNLSHKIVKILPPPVHISVIPYMDQYSSQLNSISHKLANIIFSEFGDKDINFKIKTQDIEGLEQMITEIVTGSQSVIEKVIMLKDPNSIMHNLSDKLDKVSIFNIK